MSEPVSTGPSDPQEPTSERAETPDVAHAGESGESGDGITPRPKRRRGSRGGRNRNRNRAPGPAASASVDAQQPELPERQGEGRPQTVEAAERALVRKPDPPPPTVEPGQKPKIGDSRPAPVVPGATAETAPGEAA